MNDVISLCLVITASAITPGPNNIMVLSAGAANGVWQTLPLIGGIAVGSIVMLLTSSVIFTFLNSQQLLPFVGVFGGVLLVLLAVQQWRGAANVTSANPSTRTVSAVNGAMLQPTNPKAWVLISVVLAGAEPAGISIASSALLLGGISFICLLTWSACGRIISQYANARGYRLAQRALAVILFGSAIHLSFDHLGAFL